MTEDEFLALDAASDRPNELWFGRAFYRDGESPNHCRVAARLLMALGNRLKETDLQAAGSLLRVRLDEPRAYAYPDIVIWSDSAKWSDENHDTLLTPIVLAEIVAPHSQKRDLMVKLEHYLRIPSVFDYLILWPDCVKVHHYARQADGAWHFRVLFRRDDTIFFAGLKLGIPLSEIYARLDVPEGGLNLELPFETDENEG